MPDAYREHRKQNHELCDYKHCPARQKLEYDADETMFTREVFRQLKLMGIDAREFFGNGYDDAQRKARRQFPDWLPQKPDIIHQLQAKGAIEDAIAEELKSKVK